MVALLSLPLLLSLLSLLSICVLSSSNAALRHDVATLSSSQQALSSLVKRSLHLADSATKADRGKLDGLRSDLATLHGKFQAVE